MTTKHKVFVTLACIVSAFYIFEIVFLITSKGLVAPVFVKGLIVVALMVYAVGQIRKKKSPAAHENDADS